MSPYVTERPRPVPRPVALVVKKGSKILWICSRGMPLPVSTTSISTPPLCAAVRTSSSPPVGMASRAFKKRFRKTCCSLLAEPRTGGRPSLSCLTTRICEVFRGCATSDSVSSTTRFRSTSASSPAPVREKFSRLLTISLARKVCLTIFSIMEWRGSPSGICLAHLLFHAFALRDVVEEKQAANALTRFANERRDRNIQNDQTTLALQAVFVNADDLFLIFARGNFRSELRRQEAAEGLAYRRVTRHAEDLFHAAVPGFHRAFKVHGEHADVQ